MSYALSYLIVSPDRADLDRLGGPVLVEFGAPWCGHCQRAQALIRTALTARPDVRHIKVEDAHREPLGRSFDVELWPTLVFLCDGQERARLVRPQTPGELDAALATLG